MLRRESGSAILRDVSDGDGGDAKSIAVVAKIIQNPLLSMKQAGGASAHHQ
jgi:hypothetical protein